MDEHQEQELPPDDSPEATKEAGLTNPKTLLEKVGLKRRIKPKPVRMQDGTVHHPDGRIEGP
jgi:hypothetical protein